MSTDHGHPDGLVTTTLSLASVLAEPARTLPGKVAVVEGDRSLTYAELWLAARRVAGALVADGVRPGDRVALLAPNVVEFVSCYYGILAAGGTVVPVPTLLQPHEAAYLVQVSGASLLLAHPAVPSGEQLAETTGLRRVDVTTYGRDAEPVERFVSRRPDDVAVIFFTSGTTGRPKGARLTHLNLVLNATTNAVDINPILRDDVVLGCLPLFHVYGQSVSMNSTFRVGATLVLQPRFAPREALDLMDRLGVTIVNAVPTMYVQLLRTLEEDPTAPLPRLRAGSSGGASLPEAVLERVTQVLGMEVHEGYGLSETSPTATSNHESLGLVPGSVGHAVWGCEVAIADPLETDRVVLLPVGERGEVVVRGHNVFDGYWDDEAATRAAVQDGWFRTGDIGVQDDTGRLWIVDRTKDLVIRGGFNVYPREVEEALMRHPDVVQVAVIGVPDAEYGQEVMAVAVTRPGSTLTPDELVAWSRDQVGSHKYPRRAAIVPALPLGPTMKVLKRELVKQYAGQPDEGPGAG